MRIIIMKIIMLIIIETKIIMRLIRKLITIIIVIIMKKVNKRVLKVKKKQLNTKARTVKSGNPTLYCLVTQGHNTLL